MQLEKAKLRHLEQQLYESKELVTNNKFNNTHTVRANSTSLTGGGAGGSSTISVNNTNGALW